MRGTRSTICVLLLPHLKDRVGRSTRKPALKKTPPQSRVYSQKTSKGREGVTKEDGDADVYPFYLKSLKCGRRNIHSGESQIREESSNTNPPNPHPKKKPQKNRHQRGGTLVVEPVVEYFG